MNEELIERIESKCNDYCTLPTTKLLTGRSEQSTRLLKISLCQFLMESPSLTQESDINGLALSLWLAKSKFAASSKAVIANSLANFFKASSMLSDDDVKLVKKSFRYTSPSWSTQQVTKEKVEKLIRLVKETTRSMFLSSRNQLLIVILAQTGIRVGQLVELDESDVMVEKDCVSFRVAKQKHVRGSENEVLYETKTVSLAELWCGYSVRHYIEEYLKYKSFIVTRVMRGLKATDTPFLHDTSYSRMGCTNISQSFRRWIAMDPSLGRVTAHSLRHFVGHTVANKYGIFKAAAVLGHSDTKTTQKYLNPDLIDTTELLKF